MSEVDQWGRRIKLKVHFADDSNSNSRTNDYQPKTINWRETPPSKSWTPQVDKILDTYIDKVKDDIISNLSRSTKMNITK